MESGKNNKRVIGKKSKQIISLALILAFAGVVVFSGYAYEPKDYTSSDINEDVKQTQDLENEENLTEPENEDSKQTQDLENKVNLVEPENKDEKQTQELENEEDLVNSEREVPRNKRFARRIKRAYARICEIKPDQDFINEAKELGVAPGHYLMIKALQVLDPEITVDEYKDAKGFDIIKRINELAKDSSVIENLDEDTKAIIKRAQEFTERNRNQERNFDEETPRNRRGDEQDPKNGLRERKDNNVVSRNPDKVSTVGNRVGNKKG